jgi:DnaJ-like protein
MAAAKLVTYYDNLKVARNAPLEVIRAAYRALAQKYHPDKFPDRALADHRMKIINKAYDVLSDADRRREHDAWIVEQEALKAVKEKQQGAAAGTGAGSPEGVGGLARERAGGASGNMGPHFDDAARFRHETTFEIRKLKDPSNGRWKSGAWLLILPFYLMVQILKRLYKLLGWIYRKMVPVLMGFFAIALVGGLIVKGSEWLKPTAVKALATNTGAGADTGRYSEAARTRIQAHQLTITYPQYDLVSGEFSGRLTNHSQYDLVDFTVNIEVLDCTPSCAVVTDRVLIVDARVPPGQSRDFNSFKITNMPSPGDTPVIRGRGRYQWKIIGTTADL